MTEVSRKPGDRVRIKLAGYPGVWIVDKVNPKKTIVRSESGGKRVSVPHDLLVEAGEGASVEFEPIPEFFNAGELVKWSDPRGADNLYVVLKDTRSRVNIARLGGDNDTYWRVPHARLTKVNPWDVLA